MNGVSRQTRLQFDLSRILIFIFGCFGVGMTAKEFDVTKVIIWNKERSIDSNGLPVMYVQVGANLELNCSISNGSEKDIGWKQGQKWLSNFELVVDDNKTVVLLLRIGRVTWHMNGSVYWCGPRYKDKNLQGAKVVIITGDLPKPPILDKKPRIIGLDYDINIYWKAAPYTGRLQSHYAVTYTSCFNKTYCPETPRYTFCTRPHIPGKLEYRCNTLREDMNAFGPMYRDLYRVIIATVNALGESKSPELIIDADFGGSGAALLPTPKPPLNLIVSSDDSETIEVIWKARDYFGLPTKYTVLYHKDTDHVNKTKVVVNGQTRVKLTGKNDSIEAYTIYYIYITVEFITIDPKGPGGGVSEPLGPRIIRTPEGRPAAGPDITNTSSSRYPYNPSKRNVTITWKSPPKTKWKGEPFLIKVSYRSKRRVQQDFKEKEMLITNETTSQVVLGGLNSSESYILSLKMCNTKTCGPSGEETIIESIKESNTDRNTDSPNIKVTTVAIPLSALILSIILAVLFYKIFCKKVHKSEPVSLSDRIGDLSDPIYTDRYPEAILESDENYAEADNNTTFNDQLCH